MRVRNYAEGTLEGRRDAMKVYLTWASERDLKHAAHITRPILEAYQRALWRSTKANGQRLGWSTQRTRLGVL
ncbi:MAG: recombinase XerD, partial [Verrucomicrobia bacterium]|nr:recombinase XerD [Verrucomicrobiota bacterium]